MHNKTVFKAIRAKNFRSVGNTLLSLDYMASNTTLITSEANGSGKSTLSIWALFFALYGKPYKQSAKIGSLVNSKSNKDCLVEVDFSAGGSEWTVRRGYKPALFEIIKDGDLLVNESGNAEPQARLEKIIGMNDKAFCSIVALGVDRFVPFVSMGASDRRNFVEQMLDLIIISAMNDKTKERVKVVRKEAEQLNYDVGMMESKRAGHNRTLNILLGNRQDRLSNNDTEIAELEAEKVKLDRMISVSVTKLEELLKGIDDTAANKFSKANDMMNRFKFKLDDIEKNASKITSMTDCPTCKQSITGEHKHSLTTTAEAEAAKLVGPMEKLKLELDKNRDSIAANDVINDQVNDVRVLKTRLVSKLDTTYETIKSLKAKLVNTGEDDQINSEIKSIEALTETIESKEALLVTNKAAETDHLHLLQILKDDGIKANIVEQYLPFLNKTINDILDKLNLYVQINIDSEFNITMFAPDRKSQTIDNLSTGQSRRIDLAILLAWREIAKNKASADCNLLVLDEILESLSASGVSEFMEMWSTFGSDTNLIVISQRAAEFDEYFERRVSYSLKDDMTIEV